MDREKNENVVYDKKYIMIIILCSIILFSCMAKRIPIVNNIMAWDEIGYWSNAAFLAGYDWSSVASEFASYYTYGYSFIIAILLFIFRNGTLTYQFAILINCLFIVGTFLILVKCGNILTKNKSKWLVICSAIISAFYTNNLVQSFNAWAECELIFLFAVIFYLCICIERAYTLKKLFMLTIIIFYLYCVHNRTIAFIIAGVIILILGTFMKKIPVGHSIFIIGMSVLLFIGIFVLKDYIRNGVYVGVDTTSLGNDASTAISASYQNFLNVPGIIDLIETFCNRFYYWGLTTYCSFFAVVIYYVKHLINAIRHKEKLSLGKGYIALATFGTICILTISLSNHHDYQSLLYGRYQDFLIPPLYMCGMLIIINRSNWKECIFFPLGMILLRYIAEAMPIYKDYFVINCNPVLYKYWIGTDNGGYNLLLATKISVLIFVVLVYIARVNNATYKKMLMLVVTCVLCYTSVVDSQHVFDNVYNSYFGISDDLKKIHARCEEYDKVYLVKDDTVSITTQIAMWAQVEMYDHKIIVVDKDEEIPEDNYILYPRKIDGDTYISETRKQGRFILGPKFVGLYYKGEKDE